MNVYENIYPLINSNLIRSKRSVSIMYWVFLSALFCTTTAAGCESVKLLSDTSLSKAILDKVLSKDREGSDLIVFTGVSDVEIQSLVSSKPKQLWANIKSLFSVPEDTGVARILSQYNSDRLLFKGKTKKITLINTSGDDKQAAVLRAIKQPLHGAIVDLLIVLTNRPGDKCLVYYHIINEGFSLATLERKNMDWKITGFTVETLE